MELEEIRDLHKKLLPLAEDAVHKIKKWAVVHDSKYGLAYEGTDGEWTVIVARATYSPAGQNVHCEATAKKEGLDRVLLFSTPFAQIIYTKAHAYFIRQGGGRSH